MVHDPGAAGLRQELGAEPDQATRRHQELHPYPAGAVVDHLLHAPAPQPHQLGDHTDELVGGVDGEAFDRLVDLPVDHPCHHLRLANGQFEAFAAHHFHQHRQLQLTAALHLPGVGTVRRLHPDGDVADQLLIQSRLHQPRRQLLARLPRQGRGVDADRHGDRRLVHVDQRQRLRIVRVGEGLADRDLRDARDGDDVARSGLFRRDPVQGFSHQQLGELHVLYAAVVPAPRDLLAPPQLARDDAAQRQPPQVGGGVQVGHVSLKGRAFLVAGGGHVLQDGLEQRL